ncbi:SEL1-like repeat protein [Algiphilus sp. NNCM1]|nr:SEL1-like repeat protein [Algiphilus acroporae]
MTDGSTLPEKIANALETSGVADRMRAEAEEERRVAARRKAAREAARRDAERERLRRIRTASAGRGEAAFMRGDYEAAREELSYVFEREPNNAAALFYMGYMLEEGQGGRRDLSGAAEHYQKAIDNGSISALTNLGRMYANGEGVRKDAERAVQLYREAIAHDDATAMNNLGVMYSEGLGVRRNRSRAVYWYARAAQAGSELASDNVRSDLQHLGRYRSDARRLNVRKQGSTGSEVVTQLGLGDEVYRLGTNGDWMEIYIPDGHRLGFVHTSLLKIASTRGRQPTSFGGSSRGFPPAPDSKPGVVSCRTRCWNGECYRTYDDGRKVRFQAERRIDPFTGDLDWDSGDC